MTEPSMTEPGMIEPLMIDVVSDVVCPWCFIGKRRLEAALARYREQRPDAPAPIVQWHPFQLNPEMPEAGLDRAEYLAQKFGEERAAQSYQRIKEVGGEVGIPFAFDKVVRQPNTLAAHSLIALAGDKGKQDQVMEAFFRAYFIDGRDLTSREALKEVATGAGLSAEDVDAALASSEARAHVESEDQASRDIGVQGVPFFIFNQRLAVSGAQEPDTLLEAMLEAEKDEADEADEPDELA
jgi:predicted DsbA family dithiol-disulfide isomerase